MEVAMTKKILCAIDGTDHSSIAVIQAAEMAALQKVPLTICVVNVAHGSSRGPLINHWTDEETDTVLRDAEALARRHGATAVDTIVLRAREAAGGVVGHAENSGYDQIVVGTGDKRGISRLVLGSVAGEIAGRAHCSVLVAR
jgi:nucleotide-binding universal stress UspA family protein